MKKITAYKCSFCKKILSSYSGMYKHEHKCFYNPDTRSCVTCAFLADEPFFESGKMLSKREKAIIEGEVEGTHVKAIGGDIFGNLYVYDKLSDDYGYLAVAELKTYCHGKKEILTKLKTKCKYWKAKQETIKNNK